MAKAAPDHNTGTARWDGKIPFTLQSGSLAFSTASQIRQAAIVAPCDAEIVMAQMKTTASSTGASSQFNIGTDRLGASGLFTYYGTAQLASTLTDLMSASTWVASASKKVRKGDVIFINLKKSTAVGRIVLSMQFMPR